MLDSYNLQESSAMSYRLQNALLSFLIVILSRSPPLNLPVIPTLLHVEKYRFSDLLFLPSTA